MKNANVTIRWLGTALTSLLATTTGLGAPAFSPRDFCREGGGTVLETGSPDVYICCYAARQRCLAVDVLSQLSIRVVFPHEVSDAAPAMTGGTTADSGNN